MMPTTILVEPNPGGHRSQAVAAVATVAARTSDVLLLTSRGAGDVPAFQEDVGHLDLRVEERFGDILPPTREIARHVAAIARSEDVDKVVLMDADQALKRWWLAAPRAFGARRRPRVMFMLTRYPAKLKLTDWFGWKLRIPKAALALAAMASGSLHHVAGFAGRDDMTRGWIVKRARDPEVCSAHSRDRAALRAKLDLPADRRLVGIFGGINERKNIPLIWDAMQASSIDADLLLAGPLTPDVATWVDSAPSSPHGRILVRDGFLSNEVLDQLVASVDVVPLAMTLNGPSGIMGKALAAGVPVVTAGSEVRARELVATDGGELAELDATSIGAAIERVFARDPEAPRRNTVPPATSEEFAETILGVRRRG
jgi:glycosyltransferase involved in cell wall biosynthesis